MVLMSFVGNSVNLDALITRHATESKSSEDVVPASEQARRRRKQYLTSRTISLPDLVSPLRPQVCLYLADR